MAIFLGSSYPDIFSNNNVTVDICSRFLTVLGVDPYQSFNFTVHDASDMNTIVNSDNSVLMSTINDQTLFDGDFIDTDDLDNFRNVYNMLVSNRGQYDTLSMLADYAIDGF